MLIHLNPTYTFRVVIRDRLQQPHTSGPNFAGAANIPNNRPHQFWGDGSTGCDAALQAIKEALSKAGVTAEVTLDRFEHIGG